MHPSLKVPEILYLIFKCDLTPRDLFNCSLVCRVWGIWALDVVWSTCRVPLQGVLQLLDSVAKTREMDFGIDTLYLQIGDIEENAWRRFLAHSNKIKRIMIDCKLTRACLNQIKLAKETFNGEPFGQLETVEIARGYGEYETIRLLTVPSLTSVLLPTISLPEDGSRWVANDMPAIAPNITQLQISLDWGGHLELSRHLALKYLELWNTEVRPDFWESLASCQLLRKIELMHCWHSVASDDTSGWRTGFVLFPALRTLNIIPGYSEHMLELISRSRMPMLKCLWWNAGGRPARSDMDQLVMQLKLYSPRLDTGMLYHMGPLDHNGSH